MNIICTPRQSGKTYNLITLAAERGGYIVCLNRGDAYRIAGEAKKRGLDILFPIGFGEFIRGEFSKSKEFYIDNADLLLTRLARGVHIETITLTES